MSKKALCVDSKILKTFLILNSSYKSPDLTLVSGSKSLNIFSLPNTLEERETCETDLSKVQVLPYISITRDFTTENGVVKKYLSYKRPTTGGEDRLYDKVSIGWGGHIEDNTTLNNLLSVFIFTCDREIKEELGIDIPIFRFYQSIQEKLSVFYQSNNEVGKYHLACFIELKLTDVEFDNLDIDAQEALEAIWYTKEELEVTIHESLESWSKVLVDRIIA